MQITSYTEASVFSSLSAEWNALAKRSAHHTLFQNIEWLGTWWAGLGEGSLNVLALRDAGALVGIAPLFFPRPGELAVLGYKEVTDYVDVVFAAGHERACWEATLDHISSQAWSRFNFYNIPAASPTASILPELASARGWRVDVRKEDVCPVIPLATSFEAYLGGLDGKERRELVRKLRRAEDDAALTIHNGWRRARPRCR